MAQLFQRGLIALAAAAAWGAAAAFGGAATSAAVDAVFDAAAAPAWPNVCKTGAPYSSWNETRCDAGATCCANEFSVSGMGCCPMVGATCCPNGLQCCPSGTSCVYESGTSYSTIYQCAKNGVNVTTSICTCKPGPALPFSTTLKNVLIIGDSISIGYTPWVAKALASVALVQHSPWDVSDGGAEETAYGLQCLKYFLASPSGQDIAPDVVMFNFGMHDGPMGNNTVPGQNGPATAYPAQLQALAAQMKKWAAPRGTKLLYALTSAFLCNTTSDGCVVSLNVAAKGIMDALEIPTIDLHAAVVNKCGPAPQSSCFGEAGCFCPHCVAPGYAYLANSTIVPAIKSLLGA